MHYRPIAHLDMLGWTNGLSIYFLPEIFFNIASPNSGNAALVLKYKAQGRLNDMEIKGAIKAFFEIKPNHPQKNKPSLFGLGIYETIRIVPISDLLPIHEKAILRICLERTYDVIAKTECSF